MFIEYIESERLMFEPFHEKLSPPELYRYCGPDNEHISELTAGIKWDEHNSILDSMQVLQSMRKDWVSGNTAHYALTHKRDVRFVGAASLDIDYERKQAEIGVWLRKEYWGKELATERAITLMEVGFELLDLSSITVSVAVHNEKSSSSVEKYMEKVGGRECGTIPDKHLTESGVVSDETIYAVKKEAFEKNIDEETRTLIKYRW